MLVVLVAAQFCCTSVWFAGNAVLADLVTRLALPAGAAGPLAAAVQLGFLLGTLVFAVLAVADRFSPVRVFALAAGAAALTNLAAGWAGHTLTTLLLTRAATGFCLAGIYPVGMKIASDHFAAGLGRSLGYLVGALVLGTALPHLLRGVGGDYAYRTVFAATSALCLLGGAAVAVFVPDGPHRRPAGRVRLTAFAAVFRPPAFRAAAGGYFGHMWELYSFWAFAPLWLAAALPGLSATQVALAAFGVIGVGGLACAAAGHLAERYGTARVAWAALATSGGCCLLSPLVYGAGPAVVVCFLLVWGAAVVADSPLFSTLVARAALPELRGTALTVVNGVGYAITVASLFLLGRVAVALPPAWWFLLLVPGPLAGLWALTAGGRERPLRQR